MARAFTPPAEDLGAISLEDLRRALRSIEGKYNGFRDENRRLKAVVQELRDQVDRLEQELADAVQLRTDGDQAREELLGRIAAAEGERERLSARIEVLDRELSEALSAASTATSSSVILPSAEDGPAVTISEVASEASAPALAGDPELVERVRALELERDEQRAQVEDLARLLDEARGRVAELEDTPVPDSPETDSAETAARIVELEAECERLRGKLTALADAASLEDQLEEPATATSGDGDRSDLLSRAEAAEASRDELQARVTSLEEERAELQATLDELIYSPTVPARPEPAAKPVEPAAPPAAGAASAAEVADLKETIRYLEDELSGVAGEFESVRDQYVSERDAHRKLRKEHEELQLVVEEYRTQGVPDPEEVQQLRLSTQDAQDQARQAAAERDDWRARFEQADAALELTQDALSVSQATQAELLDLKSALEQQLAQERELAARLEARIKSMESSFQARAAELARDRTGARGGSGAATPAPRPPISDARASAIDRAVSAAALAAASAAASAATANAPVAGPEPNAPSGRVEEADKPEKDRLARLESEVAMLLAALKKQALAEPPSSVDVVPSAEVLAPVVVATPEVLPASFEAAPVEPVAPDPVNEVPAVEPQSPPQVAVRAADDMEPAPGDTVPTAAVARAIAEGPEGEDPQAARRRALRQMLQGEGR
ncbi:MAG: hypothetical protein VKP72_02900 [bacterium]|nr:hypothetical protein [bacterium]